jgi:hypothetical protein
MPKLNPKLTEWIRWLKVIKGEVQELVTSLHEIRGSSRSGKH